MIDILKISRNSQIIEIVLDPPKAVNRVKEFESAKLLDARRGRAG
jgi:hypothetical protein